MTAPLLTKVWNVTPNLRKAFVSLLDLASWCMYQNKVAMVAAGWTVKFSCDGTTGPASGADTTDRWTAQANAQTRATIAGAAQSWIVLQNVDGLQVMIDYQGASDDIFRIGYSPSGVYTLAAPTTQQPTASDEVVISAGNSIVNATASLDRVMTIWCSSDSRAWRFAIFRSSAILNMIGVEKVTNLCALNVFGVSGSSEIPYVGFRHTNAARATNAIGTINGGVLNIAVGAATWVGIAARIFTAAASRITRLSGGEISINAAAGIGANAGGIFNTDKPASLNALSSPCVPHYFSGEKAANLDGFVASPIDWWAMYTSALTTPALGDMVPGYEPGDNTSSAARTNWLVALGSAVVWPWKNAGATLEIT